MSDAAPRRHLVVATAANTLGITAHMTYMYYLAPVALREAGLARGDALVFSLVALAMGAAVVPAGRLADRIPRRYVMRGGLALLGLAYAGLLGSSPDRLLTVALGTVASGVGLAFLFVSFQSYVADLLRAEDRPLAYGRAGAYAVLASAAGPFVAALVLRSSGTEALGLRANAALFALTGLAAIALTFALPSVRSAAHPAGERGRWHEAVRAAGPIALLYVLQGAGYGMTAPYFTVYFLDHVGLANDAWGYLLAAGTVATALGSLLAGRLVQAQDRGRVALAGMGGLVLASLVFLFPMGVAFLALGFLGRSFFANTVAPTANTAIMARVRPERRAEATGYASLAWNVGWAAGGASGAALLATIGGALFPLGAALAFVGVALGVVFLSRR